MKTIICCAIIIAISAQCYGESKISVNNSNWTYHYEDQREYELNRDKSGTWKLQSVSNSDSKPHYSYSSRTTNQVYNSGTQRTDSYSQQFEDRRTRAPVQSTQSYRPRSPTDNNNQMTEPGVPLHRPTNQPNYPHNPSTSRPMTHQVSEFTEQQEQRPKNANTVYTMVDDHSNVLVYSSSGLPIYQHTNTYPIYSTTSRPDSLYEPRPSYRTRPAYQPNPAYQPEPYRPNFHYPTFDDSNSGVYLSQSVNTGGPYPNYVHNYVHVPY